MITLKKIQAFLAVACEGNLTRAAESLHLSKGAISQAVIELESELGVTLFDRAHPKLKLNAEGRMLLPLATELLDRTNEINQLFTNNAGASSLRIGATQTIGNYLLPKILAQSQTLASSLISNTQTISRQLSNFELDIGLLEGEIHNTELHQQHWLDDELIVVQQAGSVNRELSGHSWILREVGSGSRLQSEQFIHQHGITPSRSMTFNAIEAILGAVSSGLGLALISRVAAADKLENGHIVQVPGSPSGKRSLKLVWHKKKYRSNSFTHFLDSCLTFDKA